MKRVLVYGAHGVVDEVGAQEQGKQKDPGVVVLVLIKGANALGIEDENLVGRFA